MITDPGQVSINLKGNAFFTYYTEGNHVYEIWDYNENELYLKTVDLEHEAKTAAVYYELLELVDGESVVLEEYAREMIHLEEMHLDEVNKMLRTPGDLEPFQA